MPFLLRLTGAGLCLAAIQIMGNQAKPLFIAKR